MRRSRRNVAVVAGLGALVLPSAIALAHGRAVDWTSVAPSAREQANHRAAQRDASGLLSRVVLPAGAAVSAGEPVGDHHALAGPGQIPAEGKLVDRHAWWTLPIAEADAAAFVRRHAPRGSRLQTTGVGDGQIHTDIFGFALPPVGQELGTRMLVISLVPLPGEHTGVRADAEVQWIVPRRAGERIPRGAHVLDVAVGRPGQGASIRVSSSRMTTINRIAALVDRLAVVQPGTVNCPAELDSAVVTFTFLSEPGGVVLARAAQSVAPAGPGGPCDPMTLTVEGRRWAPLAGGTAVVRAAQQLLGVRLIPRR
jgi:hypothetical protein